MSTVNYQSPSAFLFLHHKISVKDSNIIINNWLDNNPHESRATLSKLLESKKVLFKNNLLYNLPKLSLEAGIELVKWIQSSQNLEVKDRRHNLTNYQQCFLGSELVKLLIKSRDCLEAEAIAIGQNLLEHKLINHVLNEHEFENKPLFYQFQTNTDRIKSTKLKEFPRLSLEAATQLAEDIRNSGELEIKDRRYKLTNYTQCFIGSELVEWLIKQTNCLEQEAISIGQNLLEHNLIYHVHNQHEFKNDYLFYRFNI